MKEKVKRIEFNICAPQAETRSPSRFSYRRGRGGRQRTHPALIERADAAMYRAKQSGRNRVDLDDTHISR